MANIEFSYRQFQEKDKYKISNLMKKLYREDSKGKLMTNDKIYKTFQELKDHPEKGNIILIETENSIIGYCLIINYWSNEYSGNILTIDELFIEPAYRNKQISTNFIKYLIKTSISFWNVTKISFKLTKIKFFAVKNPICKI